MRAGTALRALATDADVVVAVVAEPGRSVGSGGHQLLDSLAADVIIHQPEPIDASTAARRWMRDAATRVVASWAPLPREVRRADPAAVDALAAAVRERSGIDRFDVVYAERLRSALWARPFLDVASCTILDLDDDEVATRRRIAEGARQRGASDLATELDAEADGLGRLADGALGWFDCVTVAAAADIEPVARRHRHPRVVELVNAVSIPPGPTRSSRSALPADEAVRLLFVANLQYLPNRWAAALLVDDVAPRLAAASGPVEIDLVGPGTADLGSTVVGDVTVHVRGYVDDLAPWYRSAAATVLCLTVGGGTRVKALEAFAHRLPVVSTSIGVEGLDVADGVHVSVADGPDALAAATLAVVEHPDAAAARSVSALAFVEQRHSIDRAIDQLRAMWR
jgi:glycosyltransferase involved in cell wall biosynthesis